MTPERSECWALKDVRIPATVYCRAEFRFHQLPDSVWAGFTHEASIVLRMSNCPGFSVQQGAQSTAPGVLTLLKTDRDVF